MYNLSVIIKLTASESTKVLYRNFEDINAIDSFLDRFLGDQCFIWPDDINDPDKGATIYPLSSIERIEFKRLTDAS